MRALFSSLLLLLAACGPANLSSSEIDGVPFAPQQALLLSDSDLDASIFAQVVLFEDITCADLQTGRIEPPEGRFSLMLFNLLDVDELQPKTYPLEDQPSNNTGFAQLAFSTTEAACDPAVPGQQFLAQDGELELLAYEAESGISFSFDSELVNIDGDEAALSGSINATFCPVNLNEVDATCP